MKITKFILFFIVVLLSIPSLATTYEVTAVALNVRTCASAKCSKVNELKRGNQINVISITNNNWCKININGQTGYVSAKYLRKVNSNSFTEGFDAMKKSAIQYWPLVISFFTILLSLVFSGQSLNIYGSIISLLGAIVYFFFGLFINMMTSIFLTGEALYLFLSIGSYALAFVVLILTIISFFKNTSLGIIIISIAVITIDFISKSYLSCGIMLPCVFGGLCVFLAQKRLSK